MKAPLLIWVLLVVGGVVLLLGAGLVAWVASEDRADAHDNALAEQRAVEADLRALARELVAQSEDIALGLSEGARTRLRDWLEQEPLSPYRDARDPSRMDVEALMNALVSQVRDTFGENV